MKLTKPYIRVKLRTSILRSRPTPGNWLKRRIESSRICTGRWRWGEHRRRRRRIWATSQSGPRRVRASRGAACRRAQSWCRAPARATPEEPPPPAATPPSSRWEGRRDTNSPYLRAGKGNADPLIPRPDPPLDARTHRARARRGSISLTHLGRRSCRNRPHLHRQQHERQSVR